MPTGELRRPYVPGCTRSVIGTGTVVDKSDNRTGKTYVTCDSHVVPHRSTEQAQGCLTSEFGWDPVLSPWYERTMGPELLGSTEL